MQDGSNEHLEYRSCILELTEWSSYMLLIIKSYIGQIATKCYSKLAKTI